MTKEVVRVEVAPGVTLEADLAGGGRDTLLVHGFPHTRAPWSQILPDLARGRRVIAPDLRGAGGSTRATDGYDAATLAGDLGALLDGVAATGPADVVAIDAGVPPAFLFALRSPHRVRRLVLIESTLGTLPGAEDFFRAGPPWWFGFHQVPGLVESVVAGNEGAYLDFFYRAGTHDGRGVDPSIREQFVQAYSGADSLRAGVGTYRAMAESAGQLAAAVADTRLTVPTLAIGARPVGDTLYRQLRQVTDDLRGELVADCGHIVPLDRPDALLELLAGFLGPDPVDHRPDS